MTFITKDMVQDWGKEAAKALIETETPLNDTITKIAQDNELNNDQVARLVEASNISTHLTINSSDNKYPEFEVADLQKVASALHVEEQPTKLEVSDYDLAPQDFEYTSEIKIAAAYGSSEDQEEKPLSPATAYRVKMALDQSAVYYDEALNSLEFEAQDAANKLKYYIKQAALSPDKRESCLSMFKQAALKVTAKEWLPATNAILEDIDKEVKETCIPSIYKEASLDSDIPEDSIVDYNNEAIQKLGTYLKAVKTYAIAKNGRGEKLAQLADDTFVTLGVSEKQASAILKAMGAPLKWAGEAATTKGTMLRSAAVFAPPIAAAGALGVTAHKMGQEAAAQKLAPMQYSKLPAKYRR